MILFGCTEGAIDASDGEVNAPVSEGAVADGAVQVNDGALDTDIAVQPGAISVSFETGLIVIIIVVVALLLVIIFIATLFYMLLSKTIRALRNRKVKKKIEKQMTKMETNV